MGELSRRSGVPIPTIKYYLREGLLSPGAATAANQAEYGDDHLRRLKLIRALIDVGGVSVAAARDVIGALNEDVKGPLDLFGAAQAAVAPRRTPDRGTPQWREARQRVVDLIAARGWLIFPGSEAIDQVADALAAAGALAVDEIAANLDAYADAADHVARVEVRSVLDRAEPAARLELVVLGTILGEALLNALRYLAHQHESARQLGIAKP